MEAPLIAILGAVHSVLTCPIIRGAMPRSKRHASSLIKLPDMPVMRSGSKPETELQCVIQSDHRDINICIHWLLHKSINH